ncbi:MAG: hypothetical protein K5978_01310 [Campylobacter sp.]|nr:hypothetical protein [Campylobacter sp.]
MNKIFLVLCLVICSHFATPPIFSQSHTFELKKDEWGRVFVTEKATQKRDSFDFRWTLFDSKNINMQSFFRHYPKHFVLSLAHGQDSFVQAVLPDFTAPTTDQVKLYVTFLEFKNKKAKFKVDILDMSNRIDTEFIDPPKATQ